MLFRKKYKESNVSTSNEPTGMFDNYQLGQELPSEPEVTPPIEDFTIPGNEFDHGQTNEHESLESQFNQEQTRNELKDEFKEVSPTQTFEQWRPAKRNPQELLGKHLTREKMLQANISINPEVAYSKNKLKEFTVSDIEDLRDVNTWLKDGKVAIIDLRETPSDELGRIVDVVTGILLALDGSQKKLVRRVFLLSGSEINIEPYYIKLNEKINKVLNK